jgi:hypothetical protein
MMELLGMGYCVINDIICLVIGQFVNRVRKKLYSCVCGLLDKRCIFENLISKDIGK